MFAQLSHVATGPSSPLIGQSLEFSVTAQPIEKETGNRAVIGRALWSPEQDGVYKHPSEVTNQRV